ncbi:MaoC family dehydratase N-terminal domain-containing protein [Aquabacter sp. L1I39]|uniref:MaoC family dehydratase n=1 Tax=Aquabacter sp. L1I39 TaxID=2820278 RepID=UPI001ADAB973|nr:MaoC/PaaZ C-terminal domain-containing protein [Aquabacter sp. L1I39]QTL05508.1 MaoC family dehydratase N-terminal domain-containing protein [Aquabacter sp. L1I39]
MTAAPRHWRVGQVLVLKTEAVTAEQLVRYAGASDDYSRIHYDKPFAEAAGLGGIIAHGMLTMAFMGRVASDAAGPGGFVRSLTARFVAPVRPGDVVRVEGKVLEVTEDGDGRLIRADIAARVRGRPVAVGAAEFRVPARAMASGRQAEESADPSD